MKILSFGTYFGAEDLEKPTAKFFFAPSDVEEQMLAVDSGVDELALNMKNVNTAKSLDPTFVSSFGRFFWEWKRWYKANNTFFRKHERSVYEGVLEYRYRLAQWRNKYEALGGQTPGISLKSAPPVKQSAPGDDLKSIMKVAAVFVGTVAVAGIAVSIAGSKRGGRQARSSGPPKSPWTAPIPARA